MEDEHKVGIDLGALKMVLENNMVRQVIKNLMPADAAESCDRMLGVLTIFERHNIGAIESFAIMREISEFLESKNNRQ